MDFLEKARIRLEHWISHSEHHLEEYEMFAEQLEESGREKSASKIREMIDLESKSTQCLRSALKNLEK